MTAVEVGLSLGANLGDRQVALAEARKRMLAKPGVSLLAQSPIYETEPVDVPDEHRQLMFLNAVLIIKTILPPLQLLQLLQFLEQQIGREPNPVRNAPRTLDIDIIYAGNLVINERSLIIPHPRWAQRRFVVQPLCDVRPDLRLPGQQATVAEILARLPETAGQVRLFTKNW